MDLEQGWQADQQIVGPELLSALLGKGCVNRKWSPGLLSIFCVGLPQIGITKEIGFDG